MDSEIGFAQLGLGSVLKQYNLAVPPNQREYAWTEKEVEALFQDLDKEIANKGQSYFLGTLVTIPRNLGQLEVVDGQQRLATAAILLSAIRNHLQEIEQEMARSIETDFLYAFNRDTRDHDPKLRLNVDDNDYFIRRLVQPDQPLESSRPSHELLAEAFSKAECQVEKIVAGLESKDHGDALNRWVSFLEYQATVILLRVPNSSNAYRMFETLNDRGIKVSQSDLVKNYLFGQAGDRFDEVQQRWAYMRGALESMEEEDTTITFLRHSLTTMYEFVREADVYDLVASRVSGSLDAVRFSGQLETLANTLVATENPEHERWNQYGESTRGALEILNLFSISPMRPLLLAIAQKFTGEEAETGFAFCVGLSVRLMIGTRTRTGTVEQGLAIAANKIYTGEIATYKQLRLQLMNITPTDGEFAAAFTTATVTNRKLARYYLRSLEMVHETGKEAWLVPNANANAINLEHVLPTKPSNAWPNFSNDEVRLYRNRIGNLTLLQATKNSGLQSADFETKKKVYADSPYETTNMISKQKEWSTTQIDSRQAYLASLALKAWKVDL